MSQNGTGRVALREVRLEGISYQSIESLRVEEEAGKHGICHLDLALSGPLRTMELISLGQRKFTVKLNEKGIIFAGIIVRAIQEEKHGIHLLHVAAQTLSCQMDRTPRSRTFQSENKTLQQVLFRVSSESSTEKPDIKASDAQSRIPQMLWQDNQTDWEFLHRLAESRGSLIFADSKTDVLRISMGPLPFKGKDPGQIFMERGRRALLGECECIRKNTDSKISPAYFTETEIMTDDLFLGVGYGIRYDGKEQIVKRSYITTEGSTLINYATIIPKEGCKAGARDELREANRGKYLTGKVLQAQGQDKGNSGRHNCIKVQFDCDQKQDKSEARWIPYMNIVNNYIFSMPDEGDRVSVYFEENGTILAIGSLRGEKPQLDDCKPENKSFLSEDEFLEFQSKELSLVAGKKSGSVLLKERDDKGITLKAKKNVVMNSTGDIVLQAATGRSLSNQTKLMTAHTPGFIAYTATGGTPPSTILNPVGGMLGVSASSLKSAGTPKEQVQLSQLAMELDRKSGNQGNQGNQKSSSGSSSGGGSGKLTIKAGKTLLLQTGDSSIEVSRGNIKTRVLYTAAYIPAGGAGGRPAAIGPGSPRNRSSAIKTEHGAKDRSRLKEGGKTTDDNKRISKG